MYLNSSCPKAAFVPRERDIYRRITAAFYRRIHAWLHATEKAGTFYCASNGQRERKLFMFSHSLYNFFDIIYHLYIDSLLGGFDEILPEIILFPSGFVPGKYHHFG